MLIFKLKVYNYIYIYMQKDLMIFFTYVQNPLLGLFLYYTSTALVWICIELTENDLSTFVLSFVSRPPLVRNFYVLPYRYKYHENIVITLSQNQMEL